MEDEDDPSNNEDSRDGGWFDAYYKTHEDFPKSRVQNSSFGRNRRKMKRKALGNDGDDDDDDEDEDDNDDKINCENIDFDHTKCRFCLTSFDFEFELLLHFIKEHNNEMPHKCPQCDHLSPMLSSLREHWKVHGIDLDRFFCSKCSKTCKTAETYEKHKKRCRFQFVNNFVCKSCDMKFEAAIELSKHQMYCKEKKSKSNYNSEPFDKIGEEKINKNNDEKCTVNCRMCQTNVNSENALREHFRKHHPGVKPFKCNVCNLELCGKLSEHLKTHGIGDGFICKICDRRFNQKFSSKIHELKHKGVEYKCQYCNQHFLTEEGMKQHIGKKRCAQRRSLHSIFCDICKLEFPSRYYLKYHLATHDSALAQKHNVACNVCGKIFKCKSTLNRHMQTHTNAKPFTCRYCGKSFAQLGNCKSHETIHEREKQGSKKLVIKKGKTL